MAEERLEPITRLTSEQKQRLKDLEKEAARLRATAEDLKELGFGVDTIMEHVEWAEKARKILLEKFS